MRLIGIGLIVAGALMLAYGGISYTRQKTVLDVGPFKATATERKTIPLSPIVGAIALVGGIVLLVIPTKRLS